MHVHLDPLGGIAGDMFIAAMTDAFPEIKVELQELLERANFPAVHAKFAPIRDQFFVGTRFDVSLAKRAHDHTHDEQSHSHRSYSDIVEILKSAELPEAIRAHAQEIFRIIAQAEAQVHGTDLAAVEFHEVGGWDSLIDVVGAALIIEKLKDATWSYSPLPKGSGFIESAHGLLPVPVPAVVIILTDFSFRDDGLDGERVTPTGAAILKYLHPARQLPKAALVLKTAGYGMGKKIFPNLSNCLRASCYELEPTGMTEDPVSVLSFEIDDMTGEELSVSLDQLRQTAGVLDVLQTPAFGKKGRITVSVRVLVRPEFQDIAARSILSKTTTLGVRYQTMSRIVLSRVIEDVNLTDSTVRVKVAHRPDGERTAKVDIDDISNLTNNCFQLRQTADTVESSTLKEPHDQDINR